MAFVYMITNRINEKNYIGATKTSVKVRFRKHKSTSRNINDRHYSKPLYQDMRKYGIDAFEVTVLEECGIEEMSQKESYYIEKYNSIHNGYNIALGGAGKPLWNDETINRWKELYEQGVLLEDIAKQYGTAPKTIGKKLREKYGINTKENSIISSGVKVVGFSQHETLVFDSQSEAARYIKESNKSQGNLIGIIRKISSVRDKENKTAYGYRWVSV